MDSTLPTRNWIASSESSISPERSRKFKAVLNHKRRSKVIEPRGHGFSSIQIRRTAHGCFGSQFPGDARSVAGQEPSLSTTVGPVPLKNGGRQMAMNEKETGNLIGSDKVEGTAVYGADANKIGSIERVMIDKVSGRVSYAVLAFGGFLGVGNDHYPLPWQSLKYDMRLGGYVTGISEQQLRGAPKYADDGDWNWSDGAQTRALNSYYGVPIA
jgi:hypothetical protein